MDFDLIAVGNATIDQFLTLHNATDYISLDSSTRELKIKSGEKIPVDSCEFLLGGNASNVSVGIARAGFKAALVAEIGTDEFSEKIVKGLKKEGVSESLIKKNSAMPSSFSVILNFAGERTIFSEHVKKDHNFNFDNVNTSWVYLTSLGEQWRDAYKNVVDFIKRSDIKLAYNPGTLQMEAGKEALSDVLSCAEIVFFNKSEAADLVGTEDIDKALRELKKLGPKTVVITDGENGSFLLSDDGQVLKHGIVPVKVVERTGGGDAYASGFLSAVLSEKNLEKAMEWGTKNAASVISKIGAQTGLLRKEELV